VGDVADNLGALPVCQSCERRKFFDLRSEHSFDSVSFTLIQFFQFENNLKDCEYFNLKPRP
jgi:hypothetical protein